MVLLVNPFSLHVSIVARGDLRRKTEPHMGLALAFSAVLYFALDALMYCTFPLRVIRMSNSSFQNLNSVLVEKTVTN